MLSIDVRFHGRAALIVADGEAYGDRVNDPGQDVSCAFGGEEEIFGVLMCLFVVFRFVVSPLVMSFFDSNLAYSSSMTNRAVKNNRDIYQ